jgi:hypothetical protein
MKKVKKRWTKQEKEWVVDNCLVYTDDIVAALFASTFGRVVSVYSIRQQRRKLGLYKMGGRGKCQVKGRQIPVIPMWLSAAKP